MTTKGKAKAKTAKPKAAKAKAAKAKPDAADEGEGGGPRKPLLMVSQKDVNDLVNKCIRRQEEVSTASGEIGKIVADAVEKKGLHRGAFNDIKKLVRMGRKDPAKLWLHLAHFDDMRKKAGLDELAGEQEQMFDSGVEKQEELPVKGGDEPEPRPGPALAVVH